MNTAIITLEDFTGERHAVVIFHCNTIEKANTIAEFLSSKSEAVVVSVKFIQETLWQHTDPNQGTAYDCVAQRLCLYFGNMDNGDPVYFEIPAPKESLLTEQQTPTIEIGGEVKALLEASTSINELFYKNGGLSSLLI